jgi:hypothetical protein
MITRTAFAPCSVVMTDPTVSHGMSHLRENMLVAGGSVKQSFLFTTRQAIASVFSQPLSVQNMALTAVTSVVVQSTARARRYAMAE